MHACFCWVMALFVTPYQVVKQTKEVAILGQKIEQKFKKTASPVERLGEESNDFANKNGKEDDPSVMRIRQIVIVGVNEGGNVSQQSVAHQVPNATLIREHIQVPRTPMVHAC